MAMNSDDLQYAKVDGAFLPVGGTQAKLDSGFYDITTVHYQPALRPSRPVSDDLIDIPGTPADEVILDIEKFMATKDRYVRCGLTHKRGYLFYGPPGTGKTSMGLMIARRFIQAGGVVIHIPGSGHLHHATSILRSVEPGRPSMFLMEEADSFVNDTTALSILDGEHSLAGAVFVAMTNYKEKMPPRIANRPGRFDRVLYVGAPPRAVQLAYFDRLLQRLNEDYGPETSVALADALDGLSLSMGHLREAFIANVLMGVPALEVRARFEQMSKTIKEPTPEDVTQAETGECPGCGTEEDIGEDGYCSDCCCADCADDDDDDDDDDDSDDE